MKPSNSFSPADELETRMARFGASVGAALTERTATLPHDVSERLRFAREQALARAAQARAAATAAATVVISPATVQLGGALALGVSGSGGGGSMMGPAGSNAGGAGLWSMLMSALPVLLLVAGLMLMEMGEENTQIAAAAEVDTALLSDSLPPAAFTDPGFSEFLRDAEE